MTFNVRSLKVLYYYFHCSSQTNMFWGSTDTCKEYSEVVLCIMNKSVLIMQIHHEIITDSVVLWKIQKFDWLIPETKWHSCLHNRTLCSYLATLLLLRQRENNPQFSGTNLYSNVGNYKFWMLILILLCENERQRWDASRYT